MQTYVFEACHGRNTPGNWGKFMVGVPDEEWRWRSEVSTDLQAPLLRQLGWGDEHVWICDLQTGEGAMFRPGGFAKADLEKHAVWVCPLFEPWLEWFYKQWKEAGGVNGIESIPRLAELPEAEFALYGYRRPGSEGERRPCS